MRPQFKIQANEHDVTEAVQDRLLELTIIDEAGIKSDQVRLSLDDRPAENGAVAALPKIGMKLSVSLGYAETGLMPMGIYLVDELELRSPPATLSVCGKAADMAGAFRSRKTRSWDATTLGGLVEKIAVEHGYIARVDTELGRISIVHLDQRAESDMALLTRLAEEHDAVAKPVHGCLILAKAGMAKSVSGKELPVIKLQKSDLTGWSFQHSARSPSGTGKSDNKPKGGRRAKWFDKNKGYQWVTEGSEPFEDLPYAYESKEKAQAAVKGKVNQGRRKEAKLSLMLAGNPRIAAECRLYVDLRQGLGKDWRIVKVEHRFSNSGYTTQVEAEKW